MTQNGIVVALEGREAKVEFIRSEACAQCRACELGTEKQMTVTMPNPLNAQVGDTVSVELHSAKLLKASALMYLIPLAALLIGLWLGQMAAVRFLPGVDEEIFAAACGFLGVLFALLGLRLTEAKRKESGEFAPQMLCIVPPTESDGEKE